MQRWVRQLVALVVLATGFVVVPPPAFAWASELETRTHVPSLGLVEVSARAQGLVQEPAASADAHTSDVHTPVDESAPVLSAVETGLDTFTAIGITTATTPSAPVAVRTTVDGNWSGWRELAADDDHRPDGAEAAAARPGQTTEPLFVERADGYEIQAPTDAGVVQVHLVTEIDRRVEITDGTAKAGSAPTINRRSSWGARAPKVIPSDAGALKLGVVHHSVNSNGYSQASVPAMLRSIQAYHMDANGWNDIAYNFAVDRFGGIWEARAGGIDRAIIGGHAYGFNTASTGVVVLGDYTSAAPSSVSIDAVERLLAWKLAHHHTPATGSVTYRSSTATHFGPEGTPVRVSRISGHRDVRQTSCPGTHLYARLPSIRDRVAALTPGAQREAPAALVEGDRTGDGGGDLLLYRPGSSSDPNLIGIGGPGPFGLRIDPPDFDVRSTAITGLFEPLTGDFDGDGRSDVFWYRPGRGADYIWYGRADGTARSVATSVSGEYEPFVGDFDGDGRDDIFWYGVYGGADHLWYGRPGSGFTDSSVGVSGNYEPHVGDFDNDGRSDILWYGPGGRIDSAWYGVAGRKFNSIRLSISGYYRPLVGDFTGDGRDDVFWYRPGPGGDYLWNGTAARRFGSTSRNVGGYYDAFVGDFDGNGFDDLFWNSPDGHVDYQWYHRAGGYVGGSARLDGGQRMVAVNPDGDADDEIYSLEGASTGRLWDRRGDGSFSNRQIR